MGITPPGPQGMPIAGSAPRFLDDQLSFITGCRQSYGDIASFSLGPDEAHLIANPDDIEQVLVNDPETYRKPNFNGPLGDVIGDGILLHEGGESWWEQRQRSQPAYSMRKFMQEEQIAPVREHTEDLIAGWDDGETTAIQEDMVRLAIRNISYALFDIKFSQSDVETIGRQLEPLGDAFEPDLVRSVLPDWMPSPPDREFEGAHANLRSFMDEIIRKRRGAMADLQSETTDGEAATEPTDVLSIMLRATQQADISEDLLRQELLTALLAGTDTTGLSLTYAWYLLAQHPEAEARLHDELESVLGGEPPTADDLWDLDYTERVLKEAMRLYPPVYLIVREPEEPVELAGYQIPEGSAVMLSQWAVHRDPQWYDEPETFDPDRWTRERAADRPKHAYFPFGAGPRRCIGKPIAEPEMKLVLATIAQNYRLEHVQGGPPEFEPAVTLQPADSVEMTVRKR